MQPNWQNRSVVADLQDSAAIHALSLVEIAESLVAGVSAALVATAILGIAKLIHRWRSRRRDAEYIRDILMEGRALVFEDEEVYHPAPNAISPADQIRAARYNNMIRRLRVALEQWAVNLSHAQRRDVFDALDWFHTKGLFAVAREGQMHYVQPTDDGKWPTMQMSVDAAQEIFERVESIKWLKLGPR